MDIDLDDKPDPIVAECVNYDQIRSWIEDCERNHGNGCNVAEHQATTTDTGLKLIDVVNLCIVDATPDVRYFALSYMWGGVLQLQLKTANCVELSQHGALKKHWDDIPIVIQDAIQFVTTIGEKYLWVDTLTIVQDDADMKHHQILQMGAIYNGAVAALVAVTGTHANAALAGVRPNTRTPERKKLQYHTLYLIDPGPDQYTSFRRPRDNTPYVRVERRVRARQLDVVERLRASEYSTRSWTYQERLLSRRCIYFMGNMVYFHCRGAIRSENKFTPYTRRPQDIRPLSLFMADPIFSGDPFKFQRTLGAVYAGVIAEFTRKSLSFSSDVLNAFSGISSAMERLCSWKFIAGVPESLLDHCLLWTSPGSLMRRENVGENVFPSWSWVSCNGPVDLSTVLRTLAGYEPFLCDIQSLIPQIGIHDLSGLRQIERSVPIYHGATELAQLFSGSIIQGNLKSEQSVNFPKNTLVFPALTLPFSVLKISPVYPSGEVLRFHDSRNWLWDYIPTYTRPLSSLLGFEIKSPNRTLSTQKGVLLSANEDYMSRSPANLEIVLVSTSRLISKEFDDWDWIVKGGITYFLLIEWKGEYAERIGTGFLLSGFWALAAGLSDDVYPRNKTRNSKLRKEAVQHAGLSWKTIRLI